MSEAKRMCNGVKPNPDYFYKYRAADDQSIESLFNRHAVFSTRNNFSDPDDGKIDIKKPTAQQIKALKRSKGVSKECSRWLGKFISKGRITGEGSWIMNEWISDINDFFDNYLFFCMSNTPKNEELWIHYGGYHKGFCVEYKSSYIRANRVAYEDKIPKLELIDVISLEVKGLDDTSLGSRTCSAFSVKLKNFEWESEYRFFADEGKIKLTEVHEKYSIFTYEPESVESVIFGCMADPWVIDHIMNNLPYRDKVKFKKARMGDNGLEIVNL